MKTGTYKIKTSDMPELKALMLALESQVDAMSDAELEAAEKEVSQSVKRLLKHPSPAGKVLPLRTERKRSGYIAGGFAFLAAALCLFLIQPSAPVDEALLISKGLQSEQNLPCELRWIQSDRSTPIQDNTGLQIRPSEATHVEVYCALPVFAHLAVKKDGEWTWLRTNQELGQGRGWLAQVGGASAIDLSPEVGNEVMVVVSRTPIDSLAVSFNDFGPVDRASHTVLWFEALELRSAE